MKITVLTLFPEFFDSFQTTSIIKKAIESQRVRFEAVNFRDFTVDKHNKVDDTPYGGGAGMVLMCQPLVDAIKALRDEHSLVVMLSPQGKTFHQAMARELATVEHLILVCGHYEGFDERIRNYVDLEVSIGDYVLTGGEVGAIVISDAIIRLLGGVIKEDSHLDDSFENGLLEYPQYTRPLEFDGEKVPDVLLSGHHKNIDTWRLKQSLKRTLLKRPDLLAERVLTKQEAQLMAQIREELAEEEK
ncbi:MAG: tRNA (guanosine(37)-N1)-methyltransferase TrmD [Erysipelotrichaceae bacterium]